MKKSYRIIFAVLGLGVIALGLVLRFALGWKDVSFAAVCLCFVGLALSFDCPIEKWRVPLRILQVLAAVLIVAGVDSWFEAPVPHWYAMTLNLAALAVNIPLAVMGIEKKK